MARFRIEYHHGPQSVEFDLDLIMQYDVVKGKTSQDSDRIVPCSNGKGKCGYEYLAESMIHERPLVLRAPTNGDFGQIISMRSVRRIVNLEHEVEPKE